MSLRIVVIALAVTAVVFGLATRVDAQVATQDLVVVGVDLTEVGESKSAVKYEVVVEVQNDGSVDFDGAARVDYQVDGGRSQIVYVITELEAGSSTWFSFRLDLEPGDHSLAIVIGDAVHETDVHVSAADLKVRVEGESVLQGGIVELDLDVTNVGDRTARGVQITGWWEETMGEGAGEAKILADISDLDPGLGGTATASFEVKPGTYTFFVTATTTTVATNEVDDAISVAYDVEFVELDVVLSSAHSVRWISGESALMEMGVRITNRGVDGTSNVEIGFECEGGSCSGSTTSETIPAGETIDATLQVWMPIGNVPGTLYAGANEQTFRWGDDNAIAALIDVPESPPLEWQLARVSDGHDVKYWSDGSANVVFETTLRNEGSDLVSGSVPISVQCLQHEELVEDCGGEFELEIDPMVGPNVLNQMIRVPQGKTELIFAHGDDEPVSATAVVPERILGVDPEVWECFSDTSNLRRNAPDDAGVGCGGWRNEYVVKWKPGVPIRIWTSGDEHYEEIFSSVLDDLAPILGLEFETASRRRADIIAYLGLPRDGTRLEGLGCNGAAGCASFDVHSDGTIGSAEMVVWPPLTTLDDKGEEHMVYSVALHELLHVLTGMLHRHDDRTSVMSYDSLDYKTLSETDLEMLRIASHSLVEPKMKFHEIEDLIVFEDELVDPPVDSSKTARQVLRRAHATLMDAGSARYEINGGWPGCELRFGKSEYAMGNLRPRAPRWVHFKDERNDFYMIRSTSQEIPLQFWVALLGRWRLVPGNIVQQAVSFRDSFSNPLSMLSSINIYASDDDLNVVSNEDGRMVLQASMEGADVRADWSRKTELEVEMEIEIADFTIQRYEMTWILEPEEANVCSDYHIEARLLDYGSKFELPEVIQSRQPGLN